ncbi:MULTISPECIES: efflux transporter outer membrane subunit [unclassified Caballeronia]|uniref:efflux transporter outer membrane subunit n=1 Tax=unclassified Caballeronia TaxID=2646786 RepID=UPI00285BD7D8|nr:MULTISPECIES: efflux transporter outer membrane subunit [unclassified Caballeronia]MDR5815685.1 efflux transporter outer membrane subunit [Caballeronia sp. LZ033]MDR5880414.1 efflux transporter outer membrane subunit [Caballeronia sp. LZ032]
MTAGSRSFDSPRAGRMRTQWRHAARATSGFVVVVSLAACMMGPDYRKPEVQIPQGFKEGVDWQRADANPQAAIDSTWWRMYHDDTLNGLVEQALQANQSIAVAEAAYRVALATVESNRAGLFPIVTAGLSGARSGGAIQSASAGRSAGSSTIAAPGNSVVALGSVSWELDLWGSVRRQIEQAKANAQASDAQLAGERLSIAASVATDYFELRQADFDVRALQEQQDIDTRLLAMTQAAYQAGQASNDDLLLSYQELDTVIAQLQTVATRREQDEHAIAVLTGVPPASLSIAPDPDYHFIAPALPSSLPSELLERRYDVVSAERSAAAANASIGVAEAAFFPTVSLSAEGGFAHNTIAHLFTVPNRFWTLGPDIAQTIFDGGARTAAMHEARANYDENVANYRNTVLTAFQSVDDSLSSMNHLRAQEGAYAKVLDSNSRIFASQEAQFKAGAASQQSVLTQRLTLIQAQQSLRDTQALLAQSHVLLVKNLGGGWQRADADMASAASAPGVAAQRPVASSD